MTKNKIIADLFMSKDFNDCISKMHPARFRDDLKAEVAIILLEKPDEKIIELDKSGGLKFFTVRIILNLIKSDTSPFYKKFRRFETIELTHDLDRPDYNYDPTADMAINVMDELYWYDKEILKLYGKLGTYRAVESVTGIPFESIYKTVQKACKDIRSKLVV